MSTEKYRFITGSLFEYDEKSNAYIHCWKNAFDDTKKKAIKAYEKWIENEEFGEDENGELGLDYCGN